MEFQKIVNLLDTTSDHKDLPRFVPKKWIEVYDQSGKDYRVNKEIRIKTPILRSDLCDFSDAYIVIKGNIIVTNPDNAKRNKAVTFKNNAPFINCISKINVQFAWIQQKLQKPTGSLWNYYRDEPSNPLSSNSIPFKYKTRITGNTYNVGDGEAGYNAEKVDCL